MCLENQGRVESTRFHCNRRFRDKTRRRKDTRSIIHWESKTLVWNRRRRRRTCRPRDLRQGSFLLRKRPGSDWFFFQFCKWSLECKCIFKAEADTFPIRHRGFTRERGEFERINLNYIVRMNTLCLLNLNYWIRKNEPFCFKDGDLNGIHSADCPPYLADFYRHN